MVSGRLSRITMKKLFLIVTLVAVTSAVPYLQSNEHWRLSGLLDTSKLRSRRPVLSHERKQNTFFNQISWRDSFVYKKGTKDFSAECGIENRNAYFRGQIVGGVEVEPNQWPWMVVVWFYKSNGFGSWSCGGTLISNEWVMTAAHCAENANKFLIIAGVHNRHPSIVEPNRQEFISYESIVHPGWVDVTKGNDIALIKLPQHVIFNEYIKPVCLPRRNEDVASGDKVTALGWGMTNSGGHMMDRLRMVELTIISDQECPHTNFYVCTFADDHKSVCQGDSGGPLIKKDAEKWIQYGITSWTPPVCASGPDGYSRVHHFLKWIETKTGIMIH